MGDSELKEAVWETARGIAYFLVGYAIGYFIMQ
jgi:hypothetical protein